MTEQVFTVDRIEALDDGTFAAAGTLHDTNFGDWTTYLRGYGDTREAALADLNANAIDAYAHAPQDDPEPPADSAEPAVDITSPAMSDGFIFTLNLGAGALTPTGGLLDA